jgi:hypothetical protein
MSHKISKCVSAAGAGDLTHLTPRGGKLFAFDLDTKPWRFPLKTLADCEPGELVFLDYGTVIGERLWLICEVSPKVA